MFFDIFYDLCKKKGVSCKRAAEDIGLSNSITTKWKKTGATPAGETLSRIAKYFGVSIYYLLGEEFDNNRAIANAAHALAEMLSSSPDAPSQQRLQLLFDASNFDIDVVCYNLGVEQSILESWLNHGNLPPRPIVDKLLGVFHIQPHQLLTEADLAAYKSEQAEWSEKTNNAPAENGKGDVLDEVDVAFYGDFKELSEDDKEIVRSMVAAMRQRRGKI